MNMPGVKGLSGLLVMFAVDCVNGEFGTGRDERANSLTLFIGFYIWNPSSEQAAKQIFVYR